MPKEVKSLSKASTKELRHAPLDRQIATTAKKAEGKFSRSDPRKLRAEQHGVDDDDAGLEKADFLDAKTSRKIMKQAQEQREEEEEAAGAQKPRPAFTGSSIGSKLLATPGGNPGGDSDSEDEEDPADLGDLGDDDDDGDAYGENEDFEVGSDGYMDIAEMEGLSEADRGAMASFFGGSSERRTINDLILDKIREKEEVEGDGAVAAPGGGGGAGGGPRLPEKVVKVYTEIGKMLKWYSSGKLPKAFKIIPSLANWEEVLWLTQPDEWSPMAVLAATRIFASNLNERMAQRFYNLILLGRVQADIEKNSRLNYHLYSAMRKSVYKPAAFYKGILLPLAQGECSLKEATVVASVLSKVSVPANHSAVCLIKLSEMPYSGPTSLFIRVLLNKKYALPHRVVDSLVAHFLGFTERKGVGELPVLWHQSLLVFCQRYKHDVTASQKESFKALFKVHAHHLITPEARRELFSGHARGEKEQDLRNFPLGANSHMND